MSAPGPKAPESEKPSARLTYGALSVPTVGLRAEGEAAPVPNVASFLGACVEAWPGKRRPRTARESGRLEREGVYVGWGTPGIGHHGLCTVIILPTDISQDPKRQRMEAIVPAASGKTGRGGREGWWQATQMTPRVVFPGCS